MTHSKSILVVEDDSDQAQEMADALIRAGYAVRTASSGDEAFAELLSVPPPSLAIVDCHLPDRSGLSIMRLTLGAGGGIPFVLVTGEPELPDGAAGLSNAVMFWRKPLDMRALVDLVKSLIGTAQKPAA